MAPPNTNQWTTDPEYIDLLNYFIEKAKDAKSPMSILSLAKEFKEKSGAPQTVECLRIRIGRVRKIIHSFEHIDTKTKVKMLFALSAPVNRKFLKVLKREALVEVDEKKRITCYQAIDGSLVLNGDHSQSAKSIYKTPRPESKQSNRWLINNYFENKNISGAAPKNVKEKEMRNLIEFITEKCENVNSPLSIRQLAKDFNKLFGTSRSLLCVQTRIASYCREIQKTEYLDTHSIVKQLFGLSETVDSNFLNELREDAVVEVDDLNRITKYEANNGSLTLYGDPSSSAKKKIDWVGRRKSKTTVEKQCNSSGNEKSEKENEYSEDDSDENSSEEIDSEFDSDEENDPLDEREDLMELSNGAIGFDNVTPVTNYSPMEMSIDDDFDFDPPSERYLDEKEDRVEPSNEAYDSANDTPVRNLSPTYMAIDDNFDFDPPTERFHTPGETETRKVDEKDDSGITGNAEIKMRKFKMAPPISNRWTTDPQYVDLLNFFILKAKDAKSPMNIQSLAEEFRKLIHCFEHIDEKTKVILFFALSASVNPEFLEELKKDAFVKVDEKKQITYYTANDGSSELRRDHSHSAKTENEKLQSIRSLRSLIIDYCENKDDTDAVPKNEDEKEIWNLIDFITEKCENADSPLNIHQLARDFNEHFETPRSFECTCWRIKTYCREIQLLEIMDAFSTVKQLFCLKATLDSEYLEKLRKDAVVEVDNLNRIRKYTANNGRLTLHGYHSLPAKKKSGSFFDPLTEKCHVSDEIEMREDEENNSGITGNAAVTRKFKMTPPFSNRWTTDPEYNELLNYLIEKAKDAKSPMNIQSLAKEFNEKSGAPQTLNCIQLRIGSLRTMIHSFDHIDRKSKVKLIFALSGSVNPEFLKELKKDAFVEVNYKQRITHYKAIDGSLELFEPKRSYQLLLSQNEATNYNNHLDEPEVLMEPSNEAVDFGDDTPVLSPTYMTFDDYFDFDPPTGRSHRSDEIEMMEVYGEKNAHIITGNAAVKTRKFETIPKSQTSSSTSSTPQTPKRKTDASAGFASSKRTKPQNGHSEEDGDIQYFIGEFDSEFDLSNYDNYIDESETLMEQSNEAVDFGDDTPVLSPTYMTFDDYFDFDPPTERSQRSDEIEMREDKENYSETTGNVEIEIRKLKMTPPISNRWTTDPQYIELLNYLIEKAKDAKSPITIHQWARDFKEKSGAPQTLNCIRKRIRSVRKSIRSFEHIDTKTKVELLFALSGSVNPEFLEELKKDAFVKIDEKNRIIYYKANDESLELGDDHNVSAINSTALFEPKRTHRSMLYSYLKKRNDPNAVPDNEEVKETGRLIEFIIEKCENIDRPLNIRQLARDFVQKFQTSTLPDTVSKRIHRYGEEIQRVEFLTIHSRVKLLFGLSATIYLDFLERLRTEALVEIDEKNRITYYKANDGSLELSGDHSASAKNTTVQFETKRRYQSLIIDYPSPTYMSFDDYIDSDPPTERFHRSAEIEMMEVYGEENADRITGNTAVKTRQFEALPSTSQTPKRKADTSAGSASSKRTKPLPEESMNLGEIDDSFFYEDPPRIDLNPFRGHLGLSDGIGEKYEEEAHFSLKSVLKSFKSLILNLDTLGLYQFLVELEMKILESGRRIEIPNKEVMVAMDFLILELTKNGALESSEDSISLREIILMLRTILMNTSFDGVELILEMLKKNIEQLKAQDKKVPVSKVDSALNATLDIICT